MTPRSAVTGEVGDIQADEGDYAGLMSGHWIYPFEGRCRQSSRSGPADLKGCARSTTKH